MLSSFDVDLLMSSMVVKVVDLRKFGLVEPAFSVGPFGFSSIISRVDMSQSRGLESTLKVLHPNIRRYCSHFVRRNVGQA